MCDATAESAEAVLEKFLNAQESDNDDDLVRVHFGQESVASDCGVTADFLFGEEEVAEPYVYPSFECASPDAEPQAKRARKAKRPASELLPKNLSDRGVGKCYTSLALCEEERARLASLLAFERFYSPESGVPGFCASSNAPSQLHTEVVRELSEKGLCEVLRHGMADVSKPYLELCIPVQDSRSGSTTTTTDPKRQWEPCPWMAGADALPSAEPPFVALLNLGTQSELVEYFLVSPNDADADEAEPLLACNTSGMYTPTACGNKMLRTFQLEPGVLAVLRPGLPYRVCTLLSGRSMLFSFAFRSTAAKEPLCGKLALETCLETQSALRFDFAAAGHSSAPPSVVPVRPSLMEGLPSRGLMHPAYSTEEKDMRMPQRQWKKLRSFIPGVSYEARMPSRKDVRAYRASLRCCPPGGRVVRPLPLFREVDPTSGEALKSEWTSMALLWRRGKRV